MPHATLLETERKIAITTSYTDRFQIKLLPGARYNDKLKAWTAPLSWGTCIALRGLFGDRLTVSDELTAWSWLVHNHRMAPAGVTRDALTTDGLALSKLQRDALLSLDGIEDSSAANPSGRRLFPYQRVDVAYLVAVQRALLCNEPGLGKTGSIIRTLQVLNDLDPDLPSPFPAVVICPNSLKTTVWKRELALWAPELSVSVVEGGMAKRRKALAATAQVYILNWESVRLHSRLAPYGQIALTDKETALKELNEMSLRTVILDEAHRAKDPHAKQTRAAWAVSHQAHYRFALTGTPIGNHVGDAWPLFHLVDPLSFPTKTKWQDRYTIQSPNFYGGATITGLNPTTQAELFKVTDPLLRRVPKSLALPQLPEKLPVEYRETPMTTAQTKAYNQMQDLMVAELEDGLVWAGNGLAKLTRLSQFSSSFAELDDGGNVRLKMPSSKVEDLVDLLTDMGDAPLVVGAVSRQLIELAAVRLTSLGISNVSVTGAQTTHERDVNVQAFQAGKARVILCTLGAGAEGLTLTRADTLLFMQQSFSAVQNKQFSDRVHRIGSEGHECIRTLVQVAPNTIDETRIQILDGKEEQAQQFLRDETILKKLLGAK